MYERREYTKPFESKVTESSIERACSLVNILLENQIRNCMGQSPLQFKKNLNQIAYILLNPNRLENNELVICEENKPPSTTPIEIVDELIEHLLGSFYYTIPYFREHIFDFFTDILDADYLKAHLSEYRDKCGRDLAMLILMQPPSKNVVDACVFIKKWLDNDKENLKHCDNFSYTLADYLFCHSLGLYERIFFEFKIDLVCSHPISMKLSELVSGSLEKIEIRRAMEVSGIQSKLGYSVEPKVRRELRGEGTIKIFEYRSLLNFIKRVESNKLSDNDWNLLNNFLPHLSLADIEGLLAYMFTPTSGDLELLLFRTVLKQCDQAIKEHINAYIISKGADAKHLFTLFLKKSQAPCVTLNFKIIINNVLTHINFPKHHALYDILTSPKGIEQEADIDRILAIQYDNDVNDIEIWLLNGLIKQSSDTVIKYAVETILSQYSLLASNLLRIMLLGLDEIDKLDYSNSYSSYLELGLTNKVKFTFQISKAERPVMMKSIGHLFLEIQANRKRKLEDFDPSQRNLELFDKKEQLTQSALPLQGWMSSMVRTKIHTVHYPGASREMKVFSPQLMSQLLLGRIKSQLQRLDFIKTITHITNVRYLNQLLDHGVFSRYALQKHKIAYLGAALNAVAEPADFDTVCFAVGDSGNVDSSALQNATSSHFPVRLTLNLSELRKSRSFVRGQAFIKEHDLFWTTKPNSEEKRALHTTSRNHEEFATCDIPKEFTEAIAFGEKQFTFYRNACGIKFIVNDNKYVLHYPYWNNSSPTPYEGQSERKKAEFNIEEEVIENDFGQTIFYGNFENIEQFFVMQFFKHIEKLPKLREIIYEELNKISDEELLEFLNQVGKKLTYGAEINFQRCFYLPIECLTKIEMLSNFTQDPDKKTYSIHYGCNHFFTQTVYQPKVIDIMELLETIRTDQVEHFSSFKAQCPTLFKSLRFIRYLLKEATPNSLIQDILQADFNVLFENPPEEEKVTEEGGDFESYLKENSIIF